MISWRIIAISLSIALAGCSAFRPTILPMQVKVDCGEGKVVTVLVESKEKTTAEAVGAVVGSTVGAIL
jgi:hypothetical protein